jgi:hypothetical protein
MCNLETSEKLKEILDKENCGDCPLEKFCSSSDSICEHLSYIKDEGIEQ